MCGRFALSIPISHIVKEFYIDEIFSDQPVRYNIAPGQQVAAIINSNGRRIISDYEWGLIPSWAKDRALSYRLINARAETIGQKPSFKNSFHHKRCLIPASGFFEWKKEGANKKPYFIRLKSQDVFLFAGLYDSWTSPENQELKTCTIITTQANKSIAPIHDRMPVILSQDKSDVWLDEKAEVHRLHALLVPCQQEEIELYEVSSLVNSPKIDDAQCIIPVSVK